MTYAKRNAEGDIVALLNEASEEGLEELTWNDPEVFRFLSQSGQPSETLTFLQQSDLDLVRVVEDLIELLVDKNIIMFTDLPEAAQQKLLGRKRARENLNENTGLMIDENEIL